MSRGRLVVHAHFYQPSRIDPFSGRLPPDPSAAPARDWNTRISEECYRPNAAAGNLTHCSWDLGPTLATWMEHGDSIAYRGFVAGDRGVNGLAQPYHHTILPLASAADRRTEIRWGLRDFELRFGRPAEGVWLPEAAVDLATLRALADDGVRYTLLAPWQLAGSRVDSRRPYRVDLGRGRSIMVAAYDAGLSTAISFDPSSTVDADRFVRDHLAPRFADPMPDDERPIVVIATDGELYGHHQPYRELFLQRLVHPRPDGFEVPYDVLPLASVVAEDPGRPFRRTEVVERTSWSCHHGVRRWSTECPCTPDGSWKAPLRSAFERLAGGIDAVTEAVAVALPGSPDPWAARDAYVDVLVGAVDAETFAIRWHPSGVRARERARFLELMEVQRWRLAMFTSDAWFWDDPARPETMHAMRAAAWAAQHADALTGAGHAGLERRLISDLALLGSPGHRVDGSEIYRRALNEVGQSAS